MKMQGGCWLSQAGLSILQADKQHVTNGGCHVSRQVKTIPAGVDKAS